VNQQSQQGYDDRIGSRNFLLKPIDKLDLIIYIYNIET